jgi:hypothetical protein
MTFVHKVTTFHFRWSRLDSTIAVEYASSVWSHQKELIKDLEMVLQHAARYVLHAYDWQDSVTFPGSFLFVSCL